MMAWILTLLFQQAAKVSKKVSIFLFIFTFNKSEGMIDQFMTNKIQSIKKIFINGLKRRLGAG